MESLPEKIVKYLITSYYFLDVVLNFNTGYYVNNEMITSRKSIALRYFKFWFWLDMIATLPYEDMIKTDPEN